jgi:hypothetical protein
MSMFAKLSHVPVIWGLAFLVKAGTTMVTKVEVSIIPHAGPALAIDVDDWAETSITPKKFGIFNFEEPPPPSRLDTTEAQNAPSGIGLLGFILNILLVGQTIPFMVSFVGVIVIFSIAEASHVPVIGGFGLLVLAGTVIVTKLPLFIIPQLGVAIAVFVASSIILAFPQYSPLGISTVGTTLNVPVDEQVNDGNASNTCVDGLPVVIVTTTFPPASQVPDKFGLGLLLVGGIDIVTKVEVSIIPHAADESAVLPAVSTILPIAQ